MKNKPMAPMGYLEGGSPSVYNWSNPRTGAAGFGTPSEDIYKPEGGEMSSWDNRPSFEPSPGPFRSQIDMPFTGGSAAENFSVPAVQAADVSSGTKKAADALAVGAGAVSWIPVVGQALGAAAGVGSLIMNWWATGKQLEENKKARAATQTAYNQQMAESNRRYDIETGLKEKALKQQEKEFLVSSDLANRKQVQSEKADATTAANASEAKQWDRWLALMTNVTSMMSTPQSRAGFANLYAR
jgi:hypothetical protein